MAKSPVYTITLKYPDDFESMYIEKYAELFCMLPQPSDEEIEEALSDWMQSVILMEVTPNWVPSEWEVVTDPNKQYIDVKIIEGGKTNEQ